MGAAASAVSIANFPLKEAEILFSYRQTYADHQKLQRESQALKARAVKLDDEAQELMDMASETMGRALKLSAGTARGFYNQGWIDWRNRPVCCRVIVSSDSISGMPAA